MMFLNTIGKDLTRWQSTLWSTQRASDWTIYWSLDHLPSIKHKVLVSYYRNDPDMLKQLENSAEVLLVSSLTTAVFFSGIPYIAVTIAVKYSLSHPPLASRGCNHPPTPQMYPRSNKTLPRYLHSLTNWDVTAAAALVLQPSHQIPNLCLLSKGVSTQCL